MDIEFLPVKADEYDLIFPIFKQYMKPVIEIELGWDEAYQRQNFDAHLQPEWFSWVFCQGRQSGLICHRKKPESIHLHLLVVFSQQQRQGVASLVLKELKALAFQQSLAFTLSCLKHNRPALNLYQRHGLVICEEDEYCYRLICHQ